LLGSCEKKATTPAVTTSAVTSITTTSAVSGGTVTDDGGASIIAKGVCWNISDKPTIENNKTAESSTTGSFTSTLSQLGPGTTYYIRAFATNSAGTSYGESITFKTLGDKPVSQTNSVSNITINSATLKGTINPNLLRTTVAFEWGTSISYGNTIIATGSPFSGSTSSDVSIDLTGLTPGTTYHFRITATNDLGITNSDDMQFTTLGQLPAVGSVTAVENKYSAIVNGSVNPNYLSSNVVFEWGLTTDYGNTVSPAQNPITGNISQNVSIELSGLSLGTTYHFRIKVSNQLGTAVSDDKSFITLAPITDLEGNVYDVVRIGTQVWTVQNLNVTRYSNGDPIENITENSTWNTLTTAGYCDYNNIPSNSTVYGKLYNWYAVNDSRNLCPTGWHVPIDLEWGVMLNLYGWDNATGGKLKETGIIHWSYPNTGATNESGFTALPGGARYSTGYTGITEYGNWWGASRPDFLIQIGLFYYKSSFMAWSFSDKTMGLSVRCLKN